MTSSPDDGDTISLSREEAAAVALHVCSRYLRAAWGEDWLSWEEFPHLDIASYELLLDQVVEVAGTLDDISSGFQRQHEIDAAYLLEKII